MSGLEGAGAVAFPRHLCQTLCHAILLVMKERKWYNVMSKRGGKKQKKWLTTRVASTFRAFANLLAAFAARVAPFLPARFAGQFSLSLSSWRMTSSPFFPAPPFFPASRSSSPLLFNAVAAALLLFTALFFSSAHGHNTISSACSGSHSSTLRTISLTRAGDSERDGIGTRPFRVGCVGGVMTPSSSAWKRYITVQYSTGRKRDVESQKESQPVSGDARRRRVSTQLFDLS